MDKLTMDEVPKLGKRFCVKVDPMALLQEGDWVIGTPKWMGSYWVCEDIALVEWPDSQCLGQVLEIDEVWVIVDRYSDVLAARYKEPILLADSAKHGLRPIFAHYRPKVGQRWDSLDELPKYSQGNTHFRPATKGGKTECFLRNKKGKTVARGLARCLRTDNFAYIVGRVCALQEALIAMP